MLKNCIPSKFDFFSLLVFPESVHLFQGFAGGLQIQVAIPNQKIFEFVHVVVGPVLFGNILLFECREEGFVRCKRRVL